MSTTILALDSARISKLTGIPKNTLIHWEKTGVFAASFIAEEAGVPFRRIYSFRDAVSLRALAKIRRELKVPLHEIRRAGEYLSQYYESPWAELRFGVIDRHLVFRDPVTKKWTGGVGQGVLELDLKDVPQEIEQRLPDVMERDHDDYGRVTKNRFVRHNQPVIAGTRIPTTTIWSFHVAGYDGAQIREEYPHLSNDDIQAAIQYEQAQRLSA